MEDFMSKANKATPRKIKNPKRLSKAPRGSGNKAKRKTASARPAPRKIRPKIREHSKLANVIAMLRQPNGASIDDLSKATDWQAHSVRGALSGTIKKKLGLMVTSAKTDGVRTYRISD
jgi:hypothetical protein